jgi:hypothetical protein
VSFSLMQPCGWLSMLNTMIFRLGIHGVIACACSWKWKMATELTARRNSKEEPWSLKPRQSCRIAAADNTYCQLHMSHVFLIGARPVNGWNQPSKPNGIELVANSPGVKMGKLTYPRHIRSSSFQLPSMGSKSTIKFVNCLADASSVQV